MTRILSSNELYYPLLEYNCIFPELSWQILIVWLTWSRNISNMYLLPNLNVDVLARARNAWRKLLKQFLSSWDPENPFCYYSLVKIKFCSKCLLLSAMLWKFLLLLFSLYCFCSFVIWLSLWPFLQLLVSNGKELCKNMCRQA